MENKYIESMFNHIEDKVILPSYPPKSPKQIIKNYIEQLEEYRNTYEKTLEDIICEIEKQEMVDSSILLQNIRYIMIDFLLINGS